MSTCNSSRLGTGRVFSHERLPFPFMWSRCDALVMAKGSRHYLTYFSLKNLSVNTTVGNKKQELSDAAKLFL